MTDALDHFSITINWKRSRSSFPGLIFEVFVNYRVFALRYSFSLQAGTVLTN